MPVPHHSVYLQAGCPSCRPTNSIKALHTAKKEKDKNNFMHSQKHNYMVVISKD